MKPFKQVKDGYWTGGRNFNIKLEGEYCQLINLKEKKIYIKKDKFEIVEL